MNKYLLKNVNLYDGRLDSDLINNIDILIDNGIIKKISKNIKAENCKIIDLTGKYVVPGLINLHSHLPASGKVTKKKLANQRKLVKFILSTNLTKKLGLAICAKNAQMSLYSGTTTIRTVGGLGNIDSLLRDKINSGKTIGPRILSSNNAIGVVNGHMDGTVAVAAKNNKEAIALVNKQINEGADLIKLMITGGILDSDKKGVIGVLRMPEDMVKACCDEAHKHNLKVAAHIEGEDGVKVGILNGVDTIEHGSFVSDELIKTLGNSGRFYVATLSPAIALAYLDPSVTHYDETAQYNSKTLLNGMIDFINKCLKNNVRVGLGTDTGCPFVTHYDMWREIVYFSKIAHVSNKFAIYSGTLNNAVIMGIDKETGSIEENKSADLIVLEKNPLEDLVTLKNPKAVFFKGKMYHKNLKKFKNQDKILDDLLTRI